MSRSAATVAPPAASIGAPSGRAVYDPATGEWTRVADAPRVAGRAGPMLARCFGEVPTPFPCLAQPKIDGVRALLSRDGLVTREGRAIVALPEFAALGALLPAGVSLDCELKLDGGGLADIAAIVQTKVPHPRRARVRLHAFDAIFTGAVDPTGIFDRVPSTAEERALALMYVLPPLIGADPNVLRVETDRIDTADDLDRHYRDCLADGFEGQMIRDPAAPYVHGRSAALIKRKPTEADEGGFVRLVIGPKSDLPRALIVRDPATGEEVTVACPALSRAERRALADHPPEPGRLVTWRWQRLADGERRHHRLVLIHSPEGRD